ncbi:MAG TPA: 23S rRNA (pseudouridine(1915)-N(3))-methyltransferase RlmH, partial [Blastocatellia bacterium]|nr:23S rRNA (pseudouridine(1915)-N(3))-methyltransferase RlmH [Blastocatellia bacterium]
MKIRFVWVGKTRSAPIRRLVDDYLERTAKFTRVEVTEVRDSGEPMDNANAGVKKEGEVILSRIERD